MQAVILGDGRYVDYTPSSAVAAGAVVVQNQMVGVAPKAIAADELGVLDVGGLIQFPKATGTINPGAAVYWDADGSPVGGVALSGALTTTSSGNTYVGMATVGAASGDTTCEVNRDGSTTTVTINETTSAVIADPGASGAIPVTNSGNVELVSAAAESRTLAAPTFQGQLLLLQFKTDGGDITLTASAAITNNGRLTKVFADAGDFILLVGTDVGASLAWRIVAENKAGIEGLVADPGNAGAIPVLRSGYVSLVTGGAETRTLAAPGFVGQQLLLHMKTDGGDCVVTVSASINAAGNTIITFNDTGDMCLLVAVDKGGTKTWRVVNSDGCSLS